MHTLVMSRFRSPTPRVNKTFSTATGGYLICFSRYLLRKGVCNMVWGKQFDSELKVSWEGRGGPQCSCVRSSDCDCKILRIGTRRPSFF
ncbi:hypothetical protein MPTK1_6g07140 [Marchantia polymorpha subsp. ruderalis]|uniref:Uncharacterized protein n=2 Tax=Marchantia polymorpha TaxID=3197 RepID=A0AAF6BPE6_MARPO|nr:hypothetical protein MARPO_0053s0028 [Marchantia polymorpha]BBN13880.1 hypothetical protein Mp_6g07140 [Marchantia polymorpha subsp. ruderalis]|eukprot:PTQ38081.1 hypothetical protein MARPO_0053s0028 [Marchantia polymorpha]